MSSKYTMLNITSKSCSGDCLGFEFKVNKFSSVTNVTTSQLATSYTCKTTWRVIVETVPLSRSDNTDSRRNLAEGNMRVGLKRTDSGKCKVGASFFFEVLNSSGQVYFKDSFEKVYSPKHAEFYCDYIRRPGKFGRVVGLGELSFGLPDDKLTIRGSVKVQDCCPKSKTEEDLNSVINFNNVQYSFRELYNNSLLSDVAFVFGKEKVYAHKNVLSARSPVFKKMFEHDLIESKSNTVKITDIEKKMFDYFLLYIYTGVIKNKEINTVLSLYSTADKYEVNTLFQMCSKILESYISDETVGTILLYANLHSDELLKKTGVHFVCNNFESVGGSSDWHNLMDTDPVLGSYILKAVSRRIAHKKKFNSLLLIFILLIIF